MIYCYEWVGIGCGWDWFIGCLSVYVINFMCDLGVLFLSGWEWRICIGLLFFQSYVDVFVDELCGEGFFVVYVGVEEFDFDYFVEEGFVFFVCYVVDVFGQCFVGFQNVVFFYLGDGEGDLFICYFWIFFFDYCVGGFVVVVEIIVLVFN